MLMGRLVPVPPKELCTEEYWKREFRAGMIGLIAWCIFAVAYILGLVYIVLSF